MQHRIAILEVLIRRALPAKRAAIRRDKVVAVEAAAYEAHSASFAGDSKRHFSIVRRLAGTKAAPLQSISGSKGEKLTSAAEITARWQEHFKDVFKADIALSREGPMTTCGMTTTLLPPPADEWDRHGRNKLRHNSRVTCIRQALQKDGLDAARSPRRLM